MSESCQAVVADFAWFSQTCPHAAVEHVIWDGQEWAVCDEHLRVFNEVGVS